MKPAPFDYVRPSSLAEACEILAGDEDARIIAGGQTLIPMLAMRLARPARLIDILRLKELRGIRSEEDAIVIGAVTRQVEVERSDLVQRALPLLTKALPWVQTLSATMVTLGEFAFTVLFPYIQKFWLGK